MRLDKALCLTGNRSRKEARDLVRGGRVSVDGVVVKDPGAAVDPTVADIQLDGASVAVQEHVYLMLNKPEGYLSATEDRRQKTVLDLVPEELFRPGLFPAGRLDADTTGFVLLTDDGAFAHSILSPKHHVTKTYLVTLAEPVTEEALTRVREGILLKDGTLCKPAEAILLSEQQVELKLVEGKYHQVKRMFAATGNRVVALTRTTMGPVVLDPALAPGECRPLTEEELKLLQEY